MEDFNYHDSAVSLETQLQPLEANRLLSKDVVRDQNLPSGIAEGAEKTGIISVTYDPHTAGFANTLIPLPDKRPRLYDVWFIGAIDVNTNLEYVTGGDPGPVPTLLTANGYTPDPNQYAIGKQLPYGIAYAMYIRLSSINSELSVMVESNGAGPAGSITAYFKYVIYSDVLDVTQYGLGRQI